MKEYKFIAAFQSNHQHDIMRTVEVWIKKGDHLFNEIWKAAEAEGITISCYSLIDIQMTHTYKVTNTSKFQITGDDIARVSERALRRGYGNTIQL